MAVSKEQKQPVKGQQGNNQKGKWPDGKVEAGNSVEEVTPSKNQILMLFPCLNLDKQTTSWDSKRRCWKKALEKYGRLGKLINMGQFNDLEERTR